MKRLIVLTADLDAEMALRALLARFNSLSIENLREGVDFDMRRHENRDSGCRGDSVRVTRQYLRTHERLLVVFDREGSGRETTKTAEEIEDATEKDLSRNGWQGRCRVVVIDPELEAWVWSESDHVASVLGWGGDLSNLRAWLEAEGHWRAKDAKPPHPKEATLAVLANTGVAFSASIFKKLASRVSLVGCSDRSFRRLKQTLHEWFGEPK